MMSRTFIRMARKAIARWREWRFEQALPEIRELKRERAQAQRQHRSTRQINKAMTALVAQRLKLEADYASR